MFRRNFLTGAAKAAVLSFSLSTGLNRLAAILPARNKTTFWVDWVPDRNAWLVNGMETIGGEYWNAPYYMTDVSDLEMMMRGSQKALTDRYNLIHGVS